MYKRKGNTLQNLSGSSVHPSQVIFCNGIILCGPQGQSTSQGGFKVGSKVCNFFWRGTPQSHSVICLLCSRAPETHLPVLVGSSGSIHDEFWETRQEETICALCLFKEWEWTHLKGHSFVPVKRCLWRVWNRQVKTKLGTGQFFHVLHSYREETTLLMWNPLSLKLFWNDRMERVVFHSRGSCVSPWQGRWCAGSWDRKSLLSSCSSASPGVFAASLFISFLRDLKPKL